METADIHDAKPKLSHLINQALAGKEVVITQAGAPLVRLVPFEQDIRPRQGGQLRGKIWMADDFDAPDPDVEKLFINGEL
jgi:prevent-host-death family protein